MFQWLFKLTLGPSVRRFQRTVRNPVDSQVAVLRDLLSSAVNTEYGQRYDFAKVLYADDLITAYQRAIPLSTYQDLLPDIDRMRQGEPDVLWPGKINDFALSSGTSASTNKELPISDALFKQFGIFAKQFIASHLLDVGTLSPVLGTSVALTSLTVNDPLRPGVRVGQIAGLVAARSKPNMLERLFKKTLPEEIANTSNLDEKIEKLVQFAMDQDVRMLAMMPRLVLRFMDLLIERFNERFNKNVSTVAEILPRLQLVVCGGQSLNLFRDSIQQRFGPKKLNMIEMYGASESMFALQQSVDDEALYLHPDNRVFFEFVRYDEMGSESPARLTVGDVEVDTPYVMYVTTCSGLWCYCMDDVVHFSSTFPHRIRVVGRASELLNGRGEAITGCQLRQVLLTAAQKLDIRPLAFHVCPLSPSKSTYQIQWIIEFDEHVSDLQQLGGMLDQHLMDCNQNYQNLRLDQDSASSDVIAIPRFGFNEWIQRSASADHAQAKVPVLANDRKFADEVLSMLER